MLPNLPNLIRKIQKLAKPSFPPGGKKPKIAKLIFMLFYVTPNSGAREIKVLTNADSGGQKKTDSQEHLSNADRGRLQKTLFTRSKSEQGIKYI